MDAFQPQMLLPDSGGNVPTCGLFVPSRASLCVAELRRFGCYMILMLGAFQLKTPTWVTPEKTGACVSPRDSADSLHSYLRSLKLHPLL